MSNLTTTSALLAWLAMGQLPTPQGTRKQDGSTSEPTTTSPPSTDTWGSDPRLDALSRKIDEAFQSTNTRESGSSTQSNQPDVSRDPLSAPPTAATPSGTRRTAGEIRERNVLTALTRNPYLPDDGLGSNAGLRMTFELQHGGFPTEALDLASYATKPVAEGGLGLEVEIGENGLPTGYLVNPKFPGKYVLQFQDNSIFVTGRTNSAGEDLPGVTFVKNNEGKYVLDKSRTEMLLGTAPFSELGAYRLNSNEYTAWLPDQLQQIKGLSSRLALRLQADGTIYDRTNKRTLVRHENGWAWDTSRSEEFRTTHLITNMDLRPLPQMSASAFRRLVNYTPVDPRPIQATADRSILFANSKNCMKHNPDSPFMHGPGYSTHSFDGTDLSSFFARRGSEDDLLKRILEPSNTSPSSQPSPEAARLLADWIKKGMPSEETQNIPAPESEPEPQPVTIPQNRVQAFAGNNGYYIITPHNLYWFKHPDVVAGNNVPLVYNFDQGDASSRSTSSDGSRYLRIGGSSKRQIDSIVRNGNIGADPTAQLASR